MDIKSILSELRSERQRLDQAVAALEALGGNGARVQTVGKAGLVWGSKAANQKKRGRQRMSPAARKRLSEMMKARWAARRKVVKKG